MIENTILVRRADKHDRVVVLTLNRPETLNALTEDMLIDLLDQLRIVEFDADVGVVIITGAGIGFCSGADLTGGLLNQNAGDLEGWIKKYANPVIAQMRSMSKPVIAAVNGVAAGAGVSLALASDILISGQAARYVPSFAKVGLAMDMGASWFLSQRIGPMRTAAWAMSAMPLDAQSALQWGLTYEVVPDNELLVRACELAGKIAEMPEEALTAVKEQINYAARASLSDVLVYEAKIQGELVVLDQAQLRIAAFSG